MKEKIGGIVYLSPVSPSASAHVGVKSGECHRPAAGSAGPARTPGFANAVALVILLAGSVRAAAVLKQIEGILHKKY